MAPGRRNYLPVAEFELGFVARITKCGIYMKISAYLFAAILAVMTSSTQALVILQYHHISDATPAATSTRPALFAQHIELIETLNLEVVSLAEVAGAIRNGEQLPTKSVLLTFDDAYTSVYENAFPLMKKRKWPFTIFVSTEPVVQNHGGHLGWNELREMANYGAELANHTHSHLHMLRKPQAQSQPEWRKVLLEEIQQAEALIKQHSGQSFKVLAYPYGEFDRNLQELLADEGYLGFGQHSGAVAPGQTTDIPRFPMGGDYADLDQLKTKLNTRPLPVKAIERFDQKGEPLRDGVLPVGSNPPYFQLTLTSAEVAATLSCYVGGQGKAELLLEGAKVTVTPNRPFAPGRTRFNCTAPADQGGYYWYSVPFIARTDNGEWAEEP